MGRTIRLNEDAPSRFAASTASAPETTSQSLPGFRRGNLRTFNGGIVAFARIISRQILTRRTVGRDEAYRGARIVQRGNATSE